MQITDFPSPNFGPRRGVAAPDMIVIHYTGMASAALALARLCSPAAAVSALVMALVFVKTSAKIKTKWVITSVAMATPDSPNVRVNRAVASDVARIFTKLLPKRTDPIRRSLSSVI